MLTRWMSFLLSTLALHACGGDSSSDGSAAHSVGGASSAGSGGGTSGASGAPVAAGGSSGGAMTCTGCAATEGCIVATVTRSPVDADMPWNLFPGKGADGTGTLRVVVTKPDDDAVKLAEAMVPGADFTSPAATQVVSLKCVAGGAVSVYAFLDDDDDTPHLSGDYLDTCPGKPRHVDVTVTGGAVTPVAVVLRNSCD